MTNYACYKIEGPVRSVKCLEKALQCPCSIQALSGHWQVLTFTAVWNPIVGMRPWLQLQRRLVPDGAFYYRVESLEQHRVLTNDWYKKYFLEDYMLCVTHDAGRKSKKLDILREMLVQEKFAIPDANGSKEYRSYWEVAAVRYYLRRLLGLRRNAPLDERQILWQQVWEWDVDYGFTVNWGVVERKKEDVPKHCQQCCKLLEMQKRNHDLHRRYEGLKRSLIKNLHELQTYQAASGQLDSQILKRIEQGEQLLREIRDLEMQK